MFLLSALTGVFVIFHREIEEKQHLEVSLRTHQVELKSQKTAVQQLQENKRTLEQQLAQANQAQAIAERLASENADVQRLLEEKTVDGCSLAALTARRVGEMDEARQVALAGAEKLVAEVAALKGELERQRAQFKDDHSDISAENEQLHAELESLRQENKLNEEALAHATLTYTHQLGQARADAAAAARDLTDERTRRTRAAADAESLTNRIAAATKRCSTEAARELEHKDSSLRQLEVKVVKVKEENALNLRAELHVLLLDLTHELEHALREGDTHAGGSQRGGGGEELGGRIPDGRPLWTSLQAQATEQRQTIEQLTVKLQLTEEGFAASRADLGGARESLNAVAADKVRWLRSLSSMTIGVGIHAIGGHPPPGGAPENESFYAVADLRVAGGAAFARRFAGERAEENARLESRLLEETAVRSAISQEVLDSQKMWEMEVKSRSKLVLFLFIDHRDAEIRIVAKHTAFTRSACKTAVTTQQVALLKTAAQDGKGKDETMVSSLRKQNNDERARQGSLAAETERLRGLYDREASEKEKLADKLNRAKEAAAAEKHSRLVASLNNKSQLPPDVRTDLQRALSSPSPSSRLTGVAP
ncbi:PREDICTED: uncharacterized abhydrolase domain-containing protein DDB_G0269086-like [Priapulus caudatus]|uniref:Uncharacterized abhydrolase domain-containing protein DDB_G0269086-like n=1 Tax=Priapulus caudatus TaxID=37621 RepID=A0ABM1EIC2_PRICU|nr:PREDICTED: uncharacterized abhydrolase domain-containing protein DDB_G0269086-like [Priapulus caudatus]